MASFVVLAGLKAPYGARCFLTLATSFSFAVSKMGLNAPYGARCFLTPFRVDEVRYSVS